MRNFFSVRPVKNFQMTREESWVERVTQNARAFFELRGVPTPALGRAGAFDLLEGRAEAGTRKRQAASLAMHGIAIAVLLLIGRQVEGPPPYPPNVSGPILVPSLERILFGAKPSGSGKGGNHDLLPPKSGNLPQPSPIVLVRPHIPDQRDVLLPVEPTILDANATQPNQHVRDLGLPWLKDRNLSNGPGGRNTIGNKDGGNSVGTSDKDGKGGESEYDGVYSPGMIPAKCLYCPDPEYSDEARHEKLQGNVTLRVLVTADGRAGRLSIVRGLGLGLDERAMETVRKWRFEPARDAKQNAMSQWVTVEVTYRLF